MSIYNVNERIAEKLSFLVLLALMTHKPGYGDEEAATAIKPDRDDE